MKSTHLRKQTALSLGLVLCLDGANEACAASISLTPVADTTIQEAFPTNNFGGGPSFQSGDRRQSGRARGLMEFNLAGSVPAGATIDSVTVTLTVTATPSGGASSIFDLHRVTSGWAEGTGSDHGGSPGGAGQATWNNRLGAGSPWAAAGGDFIITISASKPLAGNGAYTFASTPILVADVQAWVNNPAGNFGWILESENESTPTSIRRFGSRESGGPAPRLTINFTPAPEPASLLLTAMGAVIGIARRSKRP